MGDCPAIAVWNWPSYQTIGPGSKMKNDRLKLRRILTKQKKRNGITEARTGLLDWTGVSFPLEADRTESKDRQRDSTASARKQQ